MAIPARINIVTLGVEDVARSIAFDETAASTIADLARLDFDRIVQVHPAVA